MSWGMRGGWRDGAEVLGVRSKFDERQNSKKDRKGAEGRRENGEWGMRGCWRDGAEVLGVRSEFDEMKNGKKDRKVAKAAKGKLGMGHARVLAGRTGGVGWLARNLAKGKEAKQQKAKRTAKLLKRQRENWGWGVLGCWRCGPWCWLVRSEIQEDRSVDCLTHQGPGT